MSTHSAECCPHTCLEIETSRRAPSMNACCGRTLIRKTSLLRKIEPIARRSSFANKDHLQPVHLAMNERRNDLEIVKGRANCFARSNSDRSPLYDVRNPARASREDSDMRSDVSRTIIWVATVSPSSLFELRRAASRLMLGCATRSQAEAWWSQTGSNRRPHACKARALPAELWPRTRRRMLSRS